MKIIATAIVVHLMNAEFRKVYVFCTKLDENKQEQGPIITIYYYAA